ncbi:MAG: M1 family peptidase, partial [Maribacter sp.]
MLNISAQDLYVRNTSVDIKGYVFALRLNDSNNKIEGITQATVNFEDPVDEFALDLIAKSGVYGMTVDKVVEGDRIIDFRYVDNKIKIVPSKSTDKTKIFKIHYHGIPEKGLVIDTTKFGQRSFFGD